VEPIVTFVAIVAVVAIVAIVTLVADVVSVVTSVAQLVTHAASLPLVILSASEGSRSPSRDTP
jgi:hypothetical protein